MWVDSWYPPACANGGREPPDSGPATFGTHAEIELVHPWPRGCFEFARGPASTSGRDGRGQHPCAQARVCEETSSAGNRAGEADPRSDSLLNGTVNGTANGMRPSGPQRVRRQHPESWDVMRRGVWMRERSNTMVSVDERRDDFPCGDVRGMRRAGTAARSFAWATTTISAALPVFAARPAQASESLNLVPDYALFGLIRLGLIPDESGLGALWVMLIAFALLVFPLNALIFQPIFRALDARTARIDGARQRSEHLQREADSILERYEAAVRETRAEGEAARQIEIGRAREEQTALTSQAKQEAERQLESARADLTRSLESARAGLRASADELARAAAEQVLGRALS